MKKLKTKNPSESSHSSGQIPKNIALMWIFNDFFPEQDNTLKNKVCSAQNWLCLRYVSSPLGMIYSTSEFLKKHEKYVIFNLHFYLASSNQDELIKITCIYWLEEIHIFKVALLKDLWTQTRMVHDRDVTKISYGPLKNYGDYKIISITPHETHQSSFTCCSVLPYFVSLCSIFDLA